MGTPFNPLGQMKKAAAKTEEEPEQKGDPTSSKSSNPASNSNEDSQGNPSNGLPQGETAAPKMPGKLTPAELKQDPEELMSEENDDGTEQQIGG